MFDLGLAAQSICLAAHEKGLGTLIVGLYDHGKVDKALNLPDGVENVALIPWDMPPRCRMRRSEKPSPNSHAMILTK
ncbi:MAG: nitroreductase family protein [Desulfobacterales bacterium]